MSRFRSSSSVAAAQGASSSFTPSMLSYSPRKQVPLSSGEDWTRKPVNQTRTKRAFYCSIVVEGTECEDGLPEDVQDLVASFGETVPSDYDEPEPDPIRALNSDPTIPGNQPGSSKNKQDTMNDLIKELVMTEKNYVQRLRLLKDLYADPLRSYARSKETAILAPYEAKTIFGNIDQLLPVNEAFLHDLENMLNENQGEQAVNRIGDIALHHFKELRAFECYRHYYVKREEAQSIMRREMAKKSSTGFSSFVERTKYSVNDPKNRVGLRELLVEPIQRIPRYTLMFKNIFGLMGESNPQRAKLIEAYEIASKIAQAEADAHTRLAATLTRLSTSIVGFPPALISSSRRFIDCIDVEDNVAEAVGINMYGHAPNPPANGGASAGPSLHCTLVLFDDKLMFVKRHGTDKPGRTLAGLDDVERVANGAMPSSRGRGLPSMKRLMMSCKGVVDITEIAATDASATDLHLFLENPPIDQTDRWSGRSFRVLSVVLPGSPNASTKRIEEEKTRFLDNLWRTQARVRTRLGQSVALVADEQEVESRGGKATIARTYFNVYQRTEFLKEPKKTKVVVHINSLGDADPLPFGMDAPPYVIIRVLPLDGGLCRYAVTSNHPDEDPDEDIVQTSRIPGRVVDTIHQYGLFKFRTNNPSRPATPSGQTRSRANIFGLDVLSRNLFGALPGSTRGKEAFTGGTMTGHRRTKSAVSRSSTVRTDSTATTTTMGASSGNFSRSNSTAATSMTSIYEEGSVSKRGSKSRKLSKRNRSQSPGASLVDEEDASEGEIGNESFSRRRARSLSVSRPPGSHIEYSDHEEEDLSLIDLQNRERVSESEMDLSMRLELARRNSQNQQEQTGSRKIIDMPVEETIYEEDPPVSSYRTSHLSRNPSLRERFDERDGRSLRSVTPTLTSESETTGRSRAGSVYSNRERRPLGPRSPSPLPPPILASASPTINSMQMDIESTLADLSPERAQTPEYDNHLSESDYDDENTIQETPTHLPRSQRRTFVPMESTPRKKTHRKTQEAGGSRPIAIEPLSIKKKVLAESEITSPTPRRVYGNGRPSPGLFMESNRQSPSVLQRLESEYSNTSRSSSPYIEDKTRDLIYLAETTREDIESAQRAVKRIKLEVSTLPTRIVRERSGTPEPRPSTPTRNLNRITPNKKAPTREAQARMEEMRSLIGQRHGLRGVRPHSVIDPPMPSSSSTSSSSSGMSFDPSEVQHWFKTANEFVDNAESDLNRASGNYSKLEDALRHFAKLFKERSAQLAKSEAELDCMITQCDTIQRLYEDTSNLNRIQFDSFNKELNEHYERTRDMKGDKVWEDVTADIKETYQELSQLRMENDELKRRLFEAENQRDVREEILRKNGLLS